MKIYVEGQATVMGGLEVTRLSEWPFTDHDPTMLYPAIHGSREDFLAAIRMLGEGKPCFL
jgi:hypothetical protein